MVVPEWLPTKEEKEIKYTLALINGVYQVHNQEVGLVCKSTDEVVCIFASFFSSLSSAKYVKDPWDVE